MTQIKFAERLAFFRRSNSIKLKDLEELTGISAYKLSRFEQGKISPRLTDVETIAKGLHVSMRWLMGEDDAEVFEQ